MAEDARTDSELIVASLDDPTSFTEIFARHYDGVFGFAATTVGPHVAADVASEVFTRAFAARNRFDPEYQSARPWLLGIASNLVAAHLRRSARELRAYSRAASRIGSSDVEDESGVESRVDAERSARLIGLALSSLRAEEAAVVSLFVFEDLSYKEISEALRIPEGTVRSRLSRARSRLRNLLADIGESDSGDSDE